MLLALLMLASFANQAQAFVFNYSSEGSIHGAHLRAMEEAVAAFKKSHPRNSIVFQPNSTYFENFLISDMDHTARDAVPEVSVLGTATWPRLYRQDKLIPLEEVLGREGLGELRSSLRKDLDVEYYGAKVPASRFALPFKRSYPAILVNLEMLPGLKDRTSLAWSDLEKVLLNSKAPQDARNLLLSTDHWTAALILSGPIGKSILSKKKVTLASPEQISLVEHISRLVKAKRVKLVTAHHDAMVSFINRETAMILVTTASYATAKQLAKFPLGVLTPPRAGKAAMHLGGSDLVLPRVKARPFDKKTKADIREFIEWFFSPTGNALWASKTGYLPLTSEAAATTEAPPALINMAGWSTHALYELDRFCHLPRIKSLMTAIFTTAVSSPDPSWALKKGEKELIAELAAKCPEDLH